MPKLITDCFTNDKILFPNNFCIKSRHLMFDNGRLLANFAWFK